MMPPENVAMMSSVVRQATKTLYANILGLGFQPIVIKRIGNRVDVEKLLGPDASASSVFCADLDDPVAAANGIDEELNARKLNLVSLINVVDSLTPTMLNTCAVIGLD